MKFLVAQIGARMHYGVPRLLDGAGMLDTLYTDLYSGTPMSRVLRSLPGLGDIGARFFGRDVVGVSPHAIVSFPTFGLEYAIRLRLARTAEQRNAVFLWAGKRFAELVKQRGFGAASSVYAFNDAALELLVEGRRRSIFTVLEQTIAPLAVETELLSLEHSRHPVWESEPQMTASLRHRIARQSQEWTSSDLILCGSDFVRAGIARLGGPVSRCVVVPYGIPLPTMKPRLRSAPRRPLRVLTVGAVGLRKGSPYVLAAARELGGEAEFRMIGPIVASQRARSLLREHVHIEGPVPRNSIHRHYDWADVFLLPSICEGSATVTYEALMMGLPVVCTPNTGSIVTDATNGFIVSAKSSDAIVAALRRFSEPGVLAELSRGAHDSTKMIDLQAYSQRLLTALNTARPQ